MKLSFLRQINACICLDRYEGGKGYCITVSKGAFPDQSPNKNLAGLTSARFFCFVTKARISEQCPIEPWQLKMSGERGHGRKHLIAVVVHYSGTRPHVFMNLIFVGYTCSVTDVGIRIGVDTDFGSLVSIDEMNIVLIGQAGLYCQKQIVPAILPKQMEWIDSDDDHIAVGTACIEE